MISRHAEKHAVIGVALIVVFLLSVFVITPNIAPEFSGTAHLQVDFQSEQSTQSMHTAFAEFPYDITPQQISETEWSFTSRALSDEEYQGLLTHITDTVGAHTITEYQSFSPSISQELVRKALLALIIATIIIIAYISFVFKGVSRPIASWKYGVVSIAALLHDVAAPLGIFALLAPFTSASVDALFVTALLATLGYSINDTIVIFDRIRDRLKTNMVKKHKENFGTVVDYGVRSSVRRSLYTSVSTVIPLALLIALVPVTQWFGVALFVGVAAGTYSSLFFAPSLLLLWHRHFPQKEDGNRTKTDTEKAEDTLKDILQGQDVM